MLRVHCVRVPAIPHHVRWFIDGTPLEEGEKAVYAWLLASDFTEERAGELASRFNLRYPRDLAAALFRDLAAALAAPQIS